MPSNPQDPKSLGEILQKILARVDPYRNIQQQGVFMVWDDCVGENIAKNAQPEGIDRGILVVLVRNSAWNQQLNFMKDELKKKLNHKLGRNVIKDIRYKIGEIIEKPKTTRLEKPVEEDINLSPEKIDEIEKLVEEINDESLREQIKNTILAAARRKKF